MRSTSWLVAGLGLCVGLMGCGDSGGGSAGSGTGGDGGGDGGGGSGGTVPMTAIQGTVTLAGEGDDPPPAEGATVSVVGTSILTTTDSEGDFTFEVPVGENFLMASAPTNWGTIELIDVPMAGGTFDMEVVPDALVTQIAEGLDEPADTDLGMATVHFDLGDDEPVGGETATLSDILGATFSFAWTAGGLPMLTPSLLPGGLSDLIFVNVAVTSELTASPMGAEGWTCVLESPGTEYPVVAKAITDIEVACTEN